MIVDRLSPDPKRPGSIRVRVGGSPAWTVPADVVKRLALVEGQPLPPGADQVLEKAADEEAALRAGLRLVARRPHARRELSRKLGHKGHDHESIAAALDRIAQLDLLDDRVFADAYVQARAGRGRGPGRLQRDLNALGVEPDAIRAALQSLSENSDLDPWQHTLEQGRRRAAAMARLPHTTQVRRLTAFFARRGFHGEEARETIDQLIGAAGEH